MLAFGIANPLLLWGLGLGAVPVVIHLLYRRQYRPRPWAAMQFLIAATKKQSRRMQLEQWLLLALRAAALMLLSLALARPTLGVLGALTPQAAPTLRVLLVDATLSQSATLPGQSTSRFDRSRHQARQIVKGARTGDGFLLGALGSDASLVIREPSHQAAVVDEELSRLVVSESTASPLPLLTEITARLGQTTGYGRREVYLLTDLQQRTWWPEDASEQSRVQRALTNLADQARIIWIASSDEPAPRAPGAESRPIAEDAAPGVPSDRPNDASAQIPNTAITRLTLGDQVLLAERPLSLTATVQHYGPTPLVDRQIEFWTDGRLADTRRLTLPPLAEVSATFEVALPAGEHRLEVRLPEDALIADNFRRAVVSVRDEIRVLLVNGQPAGSRLDQATGLLELALAPRGQQRDRRTNAIVPTVVGESALISTDLTRYDVVFLCNVGLVTQREVQLLSTYAQGGGCVVVSLGSQVRADRYNQLLGAEPNPLLPARLGDLVGQPSEQSQWFDFDAGDYSHPIVRPFAGNPDTGLDLTRTFAYVRAEPIPQSGARIALRFNTGDPAILEHAYERGRVILITTSLDREWGTWGVWGHSFVPIMHEIVAFGLTSRAARQELLVGQALQSRPLTAAAEVSATLEGPGLPGEALPIVRTGATGRVESPPLSRSGFYELRLGPPVSRSEWFAVNVDTSESILTSLSDAQLQQDVLAGRPADLRRRDDELTGVVVDPPAESTASSSWSSFGLPSGADALTGELARLILWMVLAALLLESALAWKGTAAVAMLTAVLLISALDTAGRTSPWALLALIGALVLAGLAFARTTAGAQLWRAVQASLPRGRRVP